MVRDLARKSDELLLGLDEQRVLTLLGQPDDRSEDLWEYYIKFPAALWGYQDGVFGIAFGEGVVRWASYGD